MKAHVNNSYIRKTHKRHSFNYIWEICSWVFVKIIIIITLVQASLETQGRSVEGGETASKAFENGRKDPRNATLDEPVSPLIRIIVWDLAQNIIQCPKRGQHLSRCFRGLLIRGRLTANSTVRRTCLALAGEISAKMEPTKPKKFYNTPIPEKNRKLHGSEA